MHEGATGRRTSGLKTRFTLWIVPKRGDIRAQRAAEEHWAEKLKKARSRYRIAKSQLRQAVAGHEKWPPAEPTGSASLRIARLREETARNEYIRVLKIFSELLLRNEPEEPLP